jgi:hypothetical protein
MLIKEVETIKPIKPVTPEEQRIKSLKTQKDNLGRQIKAERDKQRIAKAQQQLNTARQAFTSSH